MGTYSDPALILPGAVGQTELDAASKKGVASGVAELDAAGALLVPGSKIYYTRDGSDDVHIYERTSDEEAYAFHRVGADDYTFFVKESNVWKQMLTESMNVARRTSGTYVGNSSVNRAIPHTLDDVDFIEITDNTNNRIFFLSKDGDFIGAVMAASVSTSAVTVPDTTNFYVGNAGSYGTSANDSGTTYKWRAFGV